MDQKTIKVNTWKRVNDIDELEAEDIIRMNPECNYCDSTFKKGERLYIKVSSTKDFSGDPKIQYSQLINYDTVMLLKYGKFIEKESFPEEDFISLSKNMLYMMSYPTSWIEKLIIEEAIVEFKDGFEDEIDLLIDCIFG